MVIDWLGSFAYVGHVTSDKSECNKNRLLTASDEMQAEGDSGFPRDRPQKMRRVSSVAKAVSGKAPSLPADSASRGIAVA
jgi:hypothetical protein